jgi:hypothetical protein
MSKAKNARARRAAKKKIYLNKRSPAPRAVRDLARATRSVAGTISTPSPPPPAKPSPFIFLPSELIYEVSDYLSDRDLASVSIANKQLYSRLYPLLYRRLQDAGIPWKRCQRLAAVQWAAINGLSQLLARLIEDSKEPMNFEYVDPTGRTLLSYAAESGDEETVLLLLRLAKKMEVQDEWVTSRYTFGHCKKFRIFSIVAEEAARRMKSKGFR